MPAGKEIVYPVFLGCCQYTDCILWENVFENLAYGIAPRGSYIYKDFLSCKQKKKEFHYKIEDKDVKLVYNEVKNLLIEKLGLISKDEKNKKEMYFFDIGISIKDSRKKWVDIKKKNVKELLIELYVSKMMEKHNLSCEEANKLLSTILISIVFKLIKPEDIDFRDGFVQEIKGVDFKNGKVTFSNNIKDINIPVTANIVDPPKKMSDNWEKHIESLKKKHFKV